MIVKTVLWTNAICVRNTQLQLVLWSLASDCSLSKGESLVFCSKAEGSGMLGQSDNGAGGGGASEIDLA